METAVMKTKLTKEDAVALHDSGFWEAMTYRDRALFQLSENLLCMPFSVFHEAVEKSLGRSVFTHEFAHMGALLKELLGEKPAPSFEEILALIPPEKLVIIKPDEE